MAEELETMFKTLSDYQNCHSLLRKHLTKEVFDKLKEKKTELGGSLADCIKSGVANEDSGVGLYACDREAYDLFSDLFDPVIKSYHKLPENKDIKHPACDFGKDDLKFENPDPDNKFIVSTRIRVGRSQDGKAFPPLLNAEERKNMEAKAKEALDSLPEALKGTYHSLEEMDSETEKQLIADHFLFKNDDRFLDAAGGYGDWPTGRGIFFNKDKTFLVWVNEEDHLRIISMQMGGDIGEVFKRLVTGIKAIEEKMAFARSDKFGFLTFCPTNLGTTLRASVHIKIPNVAGRKDFKDICDKHHLQARGIHGEHTESVGGMYDISNKRRLGLTELQAVTEMYNGVKEIIKLEAEMSWNPTTLQEMFDHLAKAKNSKSLMKKYFTKEIFDKYKDTETSTHKAKLMDCIRSGVMNIDSGVGIYAADPESYTTFADIFDPVLKDYHKLKATEPIAHPASDFGDLENLGFDDLDKENKFIVSTRIRCGRTHAEYAFPPVLTKEDREKMEEKTKAALTGLTGELKGTYHPLTGMSAEMQEQLTQEHFLFNDHDRFLKQAGGYNDWPTGRGIFYNDDKTFLVWVNEEDHMRIISMQKGGDIATIYKRLVTAIKELGEKLNFARDDKLGYLTFCPTNLGTTLRASVHIKIPHLAAKKDFKNICEKLKVQARGIHGEHTESVGGVYDISNKRRLGLSEIDAVKEMVAGVQEIIRLETDLAQGKGKSSSCTVL